MYGHSNDHTYMAPYIYGNVWSYMAPYMYGHSQATSANMEAARGEGLTNHASSYTIAHPPLNPKFYNTFAAHIAYRFKCLRLFTLVSSYDFPTWYGSKSIVFWFSLEFVKAGKYCAFCEMRKLKEVKRRFVLILDAKQSEHEASGQRA